MSGARAFHVTERENALSILETGFLGGWVDDVIGRLIDTLLSFPAIVLAIAVTGALGVGLTNSMVAVGIVFSPQLARLSRAQTLIVKQPLQPFACAFRPRGDHNMTILR